MNLLLIHLCLRSTPLGFYRHQGGGFLQSRKPTCFSLGRTTLNPFILRHIHEPLLVIPSVWFL